MADFIFNGLVALFCALACAGELISYINGRSHWASFVAAGSMCLWAIWRMA